MENCVLQCETTGVTVRTSAELVMRASDLCGAKVRAPAGRGQGAGPGGVLPWAGAGLQAGGRGSPRAGWGGAVLGRAPSVPSERGERFLQRFWTTLRDSVSVF